MENDPDNKTHFLVKIQLYLNGYLDIVSVDFSKKKKKKKKYKLQ